MWPGVSCWPDASGCQSTVCCARASVPSINDDTEGLQADRSVFMAHMLKLLLWLPSYATSARVDAAVTEHQRFVVQHVNATARLAVRALMASWSAAA